MEAGRTPFTCLGCEDHQGAGSQIPDLGTLVQWGCLIVAAEEVATP